MRLNHSSEASFARSELNSARVLCDGIDRLEVAGALKSPYEATDTILMALHVPIDALADESPARTIESELEALSGDHALSVSSGRFARRVDLPHGAEWRALYSRDTRPDYRYAFGMWWSKHAPSLREMAAWVLLNPATGDTDGNPRPILTGCRHRSERWGYNGLIILNVFAYRDRNPKALKALGEQRATGPDNDIVLSRITAQCALTVAAWGDGGAGWKRAEAVRLILHRPVCLPKTGRILSLKGQPFYPKGIPRVAKPVELPLSA